jgi:hypothetical protein
MCVNRCGVNQQWNGQLCVCINGAARINGVCRVCPLGSSPNSNQDNCECATGFIFNADTLRCIQTISCPSNSVGVI